MLRDTNNPFNDASQIFYIPMFENGKDIFSGMGGVTDGYGVPIPEEDIKYAPGAYGDSIDLRYNSIADSQKVVVDVSTPGFLGYPTTPNSVAVSYFMVVSLTNSAAATLFNSQASHGIRVTNNTVGTIDISCWGDGTFQSFSSTGNPAGDYAIAVSYTDDGFYRAYIGSDATYRQLGDWNPSPNSGITPIFEIRNAFSGSGAQVQTLRIFNRAITSEEVDILFNMSSAEVLPKKYPEELGAPNYSSASFKSSDAATKEAGLIAPYQVERFGANPIVTLTFLMADRDDMMKFRYFYEDICNNGMSLFKADWFIIDYNTYLFKFIGRYSAKAAGFGRYVVTATFEMRKARSNTLAPQLLYVVNDAFTRIVTNNGNIVVTPSP